jgi:hypothetical protein
MGDPELHGYREHLTAADTAFLARVAAAQGPGSPTEAQLREHPELLDHWLTHPAVFHALFEDDAGSVAVGLSPFLLFSVALARTAVDLNNVAAVQEWVGPGQRLFVFDTAPLRQFVNAVGHRLFLAELLTSYTHVASGVVFVRTRRGIRRQRVSELDLMHLLRLVGTAPETDRGRLYRRLGDLALFLSGVFPDHIVRYPPWAPRERQALARFLSDRPEVLDGDDVIRLLQAVGVRGYGEAARRLRATDRGAGMLAAIAEHFQTARRVLNVTIDRYVLPQRFQWFPHWGA